MDCEITSSVETLRALADPTRLRILRLLSCCPERLGEADCGPTAGQVCCQATGAVQITSTVSHHLKLLREAGLIQMERAGKQMRCTLDRSALRQAAADLLSIANGGPDDCC
ncbi:MAG: ArsR/SmtB family transcription factor [Fimbriimonadaceae bacterium]